MQNYAHQNSPIHRARASIKLVSTCLFVTGVTLLPSRFTFWSVVPFAVVIGTAFAARLPMSVFAIRLAIAQPFVLGVAVLSLFQGDGLPVFAAIALKSTICVAAIQVLVHTTHFHELLSVLGRARVPSALLLALGIVHRYLFVLAEELSRMKRARAARTLRGRRGLSWTSLASVIAVSFVRSMARSERIAIAMRARGWS